ncbi:MAG: phosphatidate cytidylyltransferase [candidate division WOR-3 bacterium]
MKELLSRIIIGFLLGVLLIITTISDMHFFLIFLLFWLGIATKEFLNLLEKNGLKLNPFLFIPINLAFLFFTYFNLPLFYFLLIIFLIFLWAILQTPFTSKYLTYGLFSIFYLAFLPSHFLLLKRLINNHQLSTWLILFPLFFTWINDTIAYGVGKIIGKKSLAKVISPKKTWEGFLSSIIFSIPFSFFYLEKFLPSVNSILFILLSIFLSILAQVGDLVESIFKREAGVKDTSRILLGHGGFLDRIDSLLFTIPAFYYFLVLIL